MQRKLDTVEIALAERFDRYVEGLFVQPDPALEAALKSIRDSQMPPIQVSPCHGKFLHLLALTCRAERILELGTLAGYSTIWLARALPTHGRLVSLEVRADYAEVARANVKRAGLADRVEVRLGPALESLERMARDGEAPFDMVFIDADKANYTHYLSRVLPLTRPGSLIVADNVVRRGDVLDPESEDESARGAREFNAALAAEPRVEALVLQLLGVKGYDGMALAVVK